MIQLFISFIVEDELLLFEIILCCYQHYQNEIKDIDYLISNYMINLFVKIRNKHLSFDFEGFHSSLFNDKQMNYNNTIIKTKPSFEEAINNINN